VAQGETKTDWVGRDMAEALGGLIGIVIVVVALVFAAPIVTGQPAGAFAKVGTHLLLAPALGAAPILASAALGAVIVLRRHVRTGDRVELGSAVGTVRHFGLVDLVLIDDHGDEVRVPYLAALLSPLRICRCFSGCGPSPCSCAVPTSPRPGWRMGSRRVVRRTRPRSGAGAPRR